MWTCRIQPQSSCFRILDPWSASKSMRMSTKKDDKIQTKIRNGQTVSMIQCDGVGHGQTRLQGQNQHLINNHPRQLMSAEVQTLTSWVNPEQCTGVAGGSQKGIKCQKHVNLHPCNGKIGDKLQGAACCCYRFQRTVVLPNQYVRHCLFKAVANRWRSTRNFGGFQLTKILKFQLEPFIRRVLWGFQGLRTSKVDDHLWIRLGSIKYDQLSMYLRWKTKGGSSRFGNHRVTTAQGRDCLYLREVPLWFASLALLPRAGALGSSEQWWSSRSHGSGALPNIANSCNSDLWNNPLTIKATFTCKAPIKAKVSNFFCLILSSAMND